MQSYRKIGRKPYDALTVKSAAGAFSSPGGRIAAFIFRLLFCIVQEGDDKLYPSAGERTGRGKEDTAMLRLLGILSLGHLLFGGRRHHLLRRGILFGALLGFLANRDFDADRVAEDVRNAGRKIRRTAHDAVRAAKREIRKADHDRKVSEIHERVKARKAEREEHLNALHAEIEARKARREEAGKAQIKKEAHREPILRAQPDCGTNAAKAIRELTEDLERDARTAAMAADVPTIDFPEEDEKYYSSRKYGYAR